MPYLLVPPPARGAEWVGGTILPIAPTKKASGFEVDLHAPRVADRLEIVGLPAPYLKRARLEGSGDRVRWTVLQEETTVFDLPEEKLTRQEVAFAPGEYRYLRLTWDDTNSARLPLPRAARARLVGLAAGPPALSAPLVFERRPSEPGVSRYAISLPGARLPLVGIELSVASGYVLRRARVTESRLDGAQMVPVELGRAMLRRAVRNDLAAAELRVPIGASEGSRLELMVEDGNNPPLDLAGVTAIFAELPWIYLEAPPSGDLVARFGSARAAAPRYDLEAARPSIARTRVADATWGERADLAPVGPVAAPAGAMPAVGAALDTSAFGYRRPVPAGPSGLTAVRLDAAVLARTRFSDLRIVTPDAHQVPYLVERLDEPLAIDLPAPQAAPGAGPGGEESGSAGSHSSYRLRLPETGLPASRLVMDTPARVFTRVVRVFVEREDRRSPKGRAFDQVTESTWTHSEPEWPAPPLSLALPDRMPDTLWLVVDEGDNSPLPLARPRLLLPAFRLRFFREADAPLTLLYGNPAATAPRYDLALLAPRLVGAPAHEVWPGPEGAPQDAGSRTLSPTRIFWAALVGAVVVLVVLLARLLRS